MLDWVRTHEYLLVGLSLASAAMFFGSLLAVPWLVVKMPADYFTRPRHLVDRWRPTHPLLRLGFLFAKNLFGVILILAGVAMLFLPGQGVLTIVVGLMCLDFPGKFAAEQRIAAIPMVIQAMNWIRHRANRPPIELPARNSLQN